jgi:hypothetical protein
MEALVALVILGICGTYFLQIALWHLADGVRLRRRALALEHVTNVLEEVRGRPWEQLQADLAEEQPLPDNLLERLPDRVVERLPDGVVHILVEPYEAGARRITVTLTWTEKRAKPSIRLVAFRSPRAAERPASE